MLEKELRARKRRDTPVGRAYRKRRRPELMAAEEQEIVDQYLYNGQFQTEVAKQHRVAPDLVSRLVTESQCQPEKFRQKKAKEKAR